MKSLTIVPIIGNLALKTGNNMSKNTSVSLGSYFDEFVQSRLSTGRYKNASEIIRAGLRLLEEEENKVIALRNAIREGIESGVSSDFNSKIHLNELKAKKKRNG